MKCFEPVKLDWALYKNYVLLLLKCQTALFLHLQGFKGCYPELTTYFLDQIMKSMKLWTHVHSRSNNTSRHRTEMVEESHQILWWNGKVNWIIPWSYGRIVSSSTFHHSKCSLSAPIPHITHPAITKQGLSSTDCKNDNQRLLSKEISNQATIGIQTSSFSTHKPPHFQSDAVLSANQKQGNLKSACSCTSHVTMVHKH